MPPAGGQRNEAHAGRNRHGHRRRPIRRGPVPELAEIVQAPAVGGARRRESAGIKGSEAQRNEAYPLGDGHRRRDRSIGRGPVPQLTLEVRSAAVADALRGHPAGMDFIGGNQGLGGRDGARGGNIGKRETDRPRGAVSASGQTDNENGRRKEGEPSRKGSNGHVPREVA